MKSKNICPECNGKKIIEEKCECNMEWRSNEGENGVDDCRCDPAHECLTCSGKGFIE